MFEVPGHLGLVVVRSSSAHTVLMTHIIYYSSTIAPTAGWSSELASRASEASRRSAFERGWRLERPRHES